MQVSQSFRAGEGELWERRSFCGGHLRGKQRGEGGARYVEQGIEIFLE